MKRIVQKAIVLIAITTSALTQIEIIEANQRDQSLDYAQAKLKYLNNEYSSIIQSRY